MAAPRFDAAPALSAYLDAAVTGEQRRLATAPDGRNNALFRAAVRLYGFVRAGLLPETAVTDMLMTESLQLGLPAREIRATLRSAWHRSTPVQIPRRNQVVVRNSTDVASGLPTRALNSLPALTARRDEAEVSPSGNSDRESFDSAVLVDLPRPAADPPLAWLQAASALVAWAEDRLWDPKDESGLDYLAQRGLSPITAFNGRIGYIPEPLVRSRQRWGLPPNDHGRDDLAIPAGIVIPYEDAHRRIIKLEVRAIRPSTRGRSKYTVPGSANALWNARRVTPYRPVVLVEGVINALTVLQEAGDLVVPVALGAATHARQIRWIARLSFAPGILIATDAGAAGEQAARYWQSLFPTTSVRWSPYLDDPNTMLAAGMDVRGWIEAGLAELREIGYNTGTL